ncbi:Low temperature viability protein-domain-containing protein [Thamnocephalis sphaerospora]|uniref:Low temperature viability protein-domain-containing protein n=1 Tax=Thamnocephalis sphaerospora TaxID=78915 RepID=A0A4P9XLL0_9FUNG|nr:Low temperature viability protein-domain-containing protein [Thamnocephalis sphaerospora]|eukprot:RKP06241.1 Low temperature viability protein-domain-containing protein [Thamnocephalis sphaerospora]
MGKKKNFIDKKNARHFHLVHRSQRDPLIADAEASERVFVEGVSSAAAGKQADDSYDYDEDLDEQPSRAGQAALYGVFLDDAEYDYTQHLRPMGNLGAVFLEAPSKDRKPTRQQPSRRRIPDVSLPQEVLPSTHEMSVGLMNQQAMPQGLQPDMDPELREALEALDIEEFVDENLDDDFFAHLDEDVSDEDYLQVDVADSDEEDDDGAEGGWEQRFLKFKRAQAAARAADGDSDIFEDRSVGTGFSMSSSAMFRNEKLTLLDDQFDKIQEEYEDSEESEDELDDESASGHGRPGLIAIKQREDFEAILDDFLDKYEIVGKKMVPMLHGTAEEKLGAIRQACLVDEEGSNGTVQETSARLRAQLAHPSRSSGLDELRPQEKERDAWDCESILSTYTNLENHPALIRESAPQRIRISRKSGMPVVEEHSEAKDSTAEDTTGDNNAKSGENHGTARPKNETAEERKARKDATKAQKRVSGVRG